MPEISLVPLDRYNWEQCLNIQLSPEQAAYTPTVLYSLAQARFESLHPYGVQTPDRMVGMIMYGEFAGVCWINRVMIDHGYQRQGIGSQAVRHIIALLGRNISCREIRTSYAPENYGAAAFFASLGFAPLPASLEDEVVVSYQQRP